MEPKMVDLSKALAAAGAALLTEAAALNAFAQSFEANLKPLHHHFLRLPLIEIRNLTHTLSGLPTMQLIQQNLMQNLM